MTVRNFHKIPPGKSRSFTVTAGGSVTLVSLSAREKNLAHPEPRAAVNEGRTPRPQRVFAGPPVEARQPQQGMSRRQTLDPHSAAPGLRARKYRIAHRLDAQMPQQPPRPVQGGQRAHAVPQHPRHAVGHQEHVAAPDLAALRQAEQRIFIAQGARRALAQQPQLEACAAAPQTPGERARISQPALDAAAPRGGQRGRPTLSGRGGNTADAVQGHEWIAQIRQYRARPAVNLSADMLGEKG